MVKRLLHVFRNTPLGRETYLQSIHFCKTLDVDLHVYIPVAKQFLMYFDHDLVQVDLDSSYLAGRKTAKTHALELAQDAGLTPAFFEPKHFTASQLPDIPTNFSYMSCPRSISDLTSKIGLGYIGPKVRRIIKSSMFPVLLASGVFKPWTNITVFYGGSNNAQKALRWGVRLSQVSGFPLELFTYHQGRHDKDYFIQQMQRAGLWEDVRERMQTWHFAQDGSFEENLYAVAHDAFLVVGAYGHGLIKEVLFGSKMESIQSHMPNDMLLVGPHCIVDF